ncbi:MAG TPA: class I SAM-dependent methyltransferase [Acidimicrobiales bacterium]|nr:class I SAM-dependent methyltransferase [Acidimicrobiales bacterium]
MAAGIPKAAVGEIQRSEARSVYGQDPKGYEVGRPEYPDRVYEVLTERCGLGPGTAVVEIGPGTGLVTRRLVAVGARVVAVEPDPAFASHLADSMMGTVEIIGTSFEEAPLADDRFDLAVAATSFHWVDQDAGMAKLGRVVRPGGWAALWWTLFGDPDCPDPFHEATSGLLGQTTSAVDQPGRAIFQLDVSGRRSDLAHRARLVDVGAELIPWTSCMDPAQVRALYASMIALRRRPQDERERLLDAVVSIATENFGGVVERPFVTALYTGRRPPN